MKASLNFVALVRGEPEVVRVGRARGPWKSQAETPSLFNNVDDRNEIAVTGNERNVRDDSALPAISAASSPSSRSTCF